MEQSTLGAVAVGVVTALVGFTSSVAVLIAGLTAVGASPAQASSGVTILCLAVGVGTVLLAWSHRMPLTLAWSTPGAALLATQQAVGWEAATGAFALSGVLTLATGAWSRLGRLVGAIPAPLAQAMLAGVLVPLCLAPVTRLATSPALIAPVVLVWLVLQRRAARWATPAAFALALVLIAALAEGGAVPALTPPRLDLAVPSLSWGAALGLAVPLTVVTMASQNVPGVAVLAGAGFRVPWRSAMLVTGGATVLGAPAGGHAVNLAAITAALPASTEAHPDPRRRWIAAAAAGITYIVLAGAGASLVGLAAAGPEGLLPSVAGLALMPTLAASLAGAFGAESDRLPGAVAFVLAASGVAILGIGAAFWALAAGLAVRALLARRAPRPIAAGT